MIKVWYGQKGIGKTKAIIDTCNRLFEQCDGDIVFIDNSDKLLKSLDKKIRFVNTKDFSINSCDRVVGLISGIISNNFDIKAIFIDGITHISNYDSENYPVVYQELEVLSKKYNIDFYISHSSDNDTVPSYLVNYTE